MIYDLGTEVTLEDPGSNPVSYSDAYDLLGGHDGVPALFGTGERLYAQFEVTAAFTAGVGAPTLQFGVAISASNPLAASDVQVLALTGGTINTKAGFVVADLTLGRTFHLSLPSWEDIMESASADWPNTKTAAKLTTFRGLRYLGAICQNVADESTNTVSAGQVKMRIIKDPSGTAVLSNIYGSRMGVV